MASERYTTGYCTCAGVRGGWETGWLAWMTDDEK